VKQRFLPFTVALCAAVSTILTGCREDAIIKSSLTPAVDNIHTFGIGPDFNNNTDTLTAITMLTGTAFEDSLITSSRGGGIPIVHALGHVNDPFAGTTTASIFMQVVPTAAGFKLPANTTIDELVLVLPYAGFTWGDTATTRTRQVNVYQIQERFDKDSIFYNFSSRAVQPAIIGSGTLATGPTNSGAVQDSVSVFGKKQAPHLRISLTPAFKAEFEDAVKSDSTFDAFTERLPGFCISLADTNAHDEALPYFRLNGGVELYSAASIVAYAHTNGGTDTLIYQFPYDERYAAHFNRITRKYSAAATSLQDTATVQELVAMQNGPGLTIDVRMPHIQDLFKSLNIKNAIINKAELVFTQVEDPTMSAQKFFGPLRLYPQGINAGGGRYTIADRYLGTGTPFEALDFIDGTPRTVVKDGKTVTEYRINIPREVQKAIVQGSQGLHLRIGGTINFPAAYRLILGGRGNANPAYRPSINIIYSKQ
jgi:hypothetical protein